MIKIIPAVEEKRITYCDKCKNEVKVIVNLRGNEPLQDTSGAVCASNKIKLDLCLSCFYKVKKFIEG